MRVLTVFAGVLLVAAGVFSIANQGVSFLSIAFIIGLSMVISGTIQSSGYIYGRYMSKDSVETGNGDLPDALSAQESRVQKNAHGWIMIDGTVTFVLGLLVLSNQIKAEVAVVSVFALWMLTAGIRRIVTSTYIDRFEKSGNYYWTLGTGVLSAGAGLYGFYNTSLLQLPVASLLGIFFVLQGISTLELGIHMPHKRRTHGILDDIEKMFHKRPNELNAMKKQELLTFAEERKISVRRSGTRDEIIRAIENAMKAVGKRRK